MLQKVWQPELHKILCNVKEVSAMSSQRKKTMIQEWHTVGRCRPFLSSEDKLILHAAIFFRNDVPAVSKLLGQVLHRPKEAICRRCRELGVWLSISFPIIFLAEVVLILHLLMMKLPAAKLL